MEDSQETQFGFIDSIKYNVENIILNKLDYTNIYDINNKEPEILRIVFQILISNII